LTGILPFYAKAKEEIIAKNKKGDLLFPEEIWKTVTPDAKDLVMRMTSRDQYKRISAKECLEHKWLQAGVTNMNPLFIAETPCEIQASL